jgi:hypothetical protein
MNILSATDGRGIFSIFLKFSGDRFVCQKYDFGRPGDSWGKFSAQVRIISRTSYTYEVWIKGSLYPSLFCISGHTGGGRKRMFYISQSASPTLGFFNLYQTSEP